MTITASQVKDLRERTGLGMMECKGALTETNGDMDAAIELLRKKAGAKVETKAGRTAAEGAIGIFVSQVGNKVVAAARRVAQGDEFAAFAGSIAQCVAENKPAGVDALAALPLVKGGKTVAQVREGLVAKLGENISVRRFDHYSSAKGHIAAYVHGRRIGVLVEMNGGDEALARDIAMHIAASRPECVSRDQVPADKIAKEKEIFTAQAAESGKPAEIIEKMVVGRINKFLAEITLLGQPFVKDPDTSVEKLLKGAGASVVRFARYEVGEGIEKKSADFAAEVMAQVKGG